METYRVLSDLKLDVAHLARYSLREGTVATRRMEDNVPEEDKLRRLHMLDDLQEEIVAEINKKYLGEKVEVLFEDKVKGRWRGRTPTNKIVFVESDEDLRGKVIPVTVTWTGPWSMQAGERIRVVWKSLHEFGEGKSTLYPNGLLEMLRTAH
jgi:tRNA-2-methylthio-N6-dimethylallyladenosine synthase